MDTRRCPICGEPQPARHDAMGTHLASRRYTELERDLWRTRYKPARTLLWRWLLTGRTN
jgi:hypothetical protein